MLSKEHIIKIMMDVQNGKAPKVMLNFATPDSIFIQPKNRTLNYIKLSKLDYEAAVKYIEENNISAIMNVSKFVFHSDEEQTKN